MYERLVNQLKEYSHAIRILSKGYLPISLLPPSKLAKILQEVKQVLLKTNKNYGLVIKGMYKYYDMKLVMFGIDHNRNLIIQFPVFVQPYTQKPLTLYQVETIPVPILDMNKRADSYTWIRIDKPYITLNPDTYISIRMEELRTCKKIGYEYYCEELFVVKSEAKYSCASALYFQLDRQMIKENCIFDYYYNKTDVKPSILDGGYEIVLANWPSFKRIVCFTHNNIPIEIPSHLYVLLNRMALCNLDNEKEDDTFIETSIIQLHSAILFNCIIEAASNFLLESIAACDPERDNVDLEMYFVANTAFLNYFDELISTLDIPFFHNITRQEHVLPISLESDDFDEQLLSAPKTLRELFERYRQKKISFDKQHKTLDNEKEDDTFIETSIFKHLAFNIFIFVMAIILVIVMFIVIKLIFKAEKMQTLLANLAMVRGVKAISEEIEAIDKEYWIIIIWLSLILLCVLFLTIEKLYRMPIFRKYCYSNTIKIMIFMSDIKSYVPIKLCKTSGSIHLFKLTGSINKENITLHKNTLWDVMEIDWRPVTVTLSKNVINLPGSVIIPFRDKFKIRWIIKSRPLLLHLMLKQGQTWYLLSHIRDIMEIENNVPQSVDMQIEP